MYDLLLPKFNATLALDGYDDWIHGLPLDDLPAAPLHASCGLKHPLMLLRARTPLFHRDVLAFLRERGADNLQSVQVALHTPGGVRDEWHAVNVVGRIPLAAFVLELPPAEVFPPRRQPAARAAMEAAAPGIEAVRRAPPLPRPDAVVARLSEGDHPLLIRSDVMAELDARFNREVRGSIVHHVRFDDVRFCDLYMDGDFRQLMMQACAALPTGQGEG